MTIYIYGNKSFKNNIHSVFEHANMKFRLNDEDSIVELSSLKKLKDAIKENPKNIFLIDEDKIIKKDSLNEKLNLFKSKDRIEEEFLKEHGVMGELSVDNVADITLPIIRKLEEEHDRLDALKEETKDEIQSLNENEYDKNNLTDVSTKENDFNFFDEELESLINFEDDLPIDSLKYENNYKYDSINLDDEDFGLIVEEIKDKNENRIDLEQEDFDLEIEEIDSKRGDEMQNDFSELDSLNEDDLLKALGDSNSTSNEIKKKTNSQTEVELSNSNINDISSLITQLLNNKTLEITIKIKE